ncbi:MAG: TIGR00282 family metallophosphoesterase [Pirellulaceae bacterium]|nr:TIGR00282 family metallophosphoesterase [Pirellulaceae bacterium]
MTSQAYPIPNAPPPGLIRIVLVGDTVGKPGMNVVCLATRWLKQRLKAHLVIVNAENAADGTGLRQREYRRLIEAGVDAITLGDHIYKKREIIETLQSADNIVKPANFPAEAPGKTWCVVQTADGVQVAVISIMGRVFMRPVDCPFSALKKVLEEIPKEVALKIVDVHAEATSDKQTLGRYFDGHVTAMLGTHTHVTTADEQIFPQGTGFQCDIGMTGSYESILGREIAPVTLTTLTFEPAAFDVASGDVRLAATWIDADPATGKCVAIGRVQWPLELIRMWDQEQAELMKRL